MVVLDKGQEELVDDGLNACGVHRFEVHEQVVAHQIDRHGEHGGGDAVQVDLAAVVGASVDDLGAPWQLVAEELGADLGRGQAGVGQQSGEGSRCGDGDEAGAGFAGRRAGRAAPSVR